MFRYLDGLPAAVTAGPGGRIDPGIVRRLDAIAASLREPRPPMRRPAAGVDPPLLSAPRRGQTHVTARQPS
jgi:hypothetical protein